MNIIPYLNKSAYAGRYYPQELTDANDKKEGIKMQNSSVLSAIKTKLLPYYGSRVRLYVIGDRNRITDTTGILDGLYPSLFTVTVDRGRFKHHYSFTYSEILTDRVRVTPAF